MNKFFFAFAFVIISLSTLGIRGQGRPEWLGRFEDTLKAKEKLWKIDNRLVNADGSLYSESFRLKKGAFTGAVQIQAYYILENPDETFTGLVLASDNIMGKRQTKTKLEGLGTEAYMWSGNNADDYTTVFFKKDKIFVTVFMPGRATAQRFAKHVASQIP